MGDKRTETAKVFSPLVTETSVWVLMSVYWTGKEDVPVRQEAVLLRRDVPDKGCGAGLSPVPSSLLLNLRPVSLY